MERIPVNITSLVKVLSWWKCSGVLLFGSLNNMISSGKMIAGTL
jgi:hypothetical protein